MRDDSESGGVGMNLWAGATNCSAYHVPDDHAIQHGMH
jgi:hypothetical protein